jgi:tetratricopeptide (TPR) repeat protein
MATHEPRPDPSVPPDVGDQNVERLLRAAYQPERPDPAFAQRVEMLMYVAALKQAGQAGTSAGAAGRGRWLFRWSALAAAAVIGFLAFVWHPFDRGPSGEVVIINGEAYMRLGQRFERVEAGVVPRLGGRGDNESRPADPPPNRGHLVALGRPTPPPAATLAVGASACTAAGERRRLTLPDGSVLYLNENTTVTLAAQRQLTLTAGEVYVEVAPRPAGADGATFLVSTPNRQVTALGTKFAVTAGPAGTGVLVTQGKVQVSGGPADDVLVAGQQLLPGRVVAAAPRASHLLAWTRELMAAAEAPLVPVSPYSGGALVAIGADGQETSLSLRRYHVDVHIEDGFARTTIDQTYFNHETVRLEGTFHFPLPPDASVSRLAMYVDGVLMEGGMAARDHAAQVFETIVRSMRDPALLEWIDGSMFKMRVFPLEPRQEKRIILSYTQRLPALYGCTTYRFPAGHSLGQVGTWSFHARLKGGADLSWRCGSHELHARQDGADLVLTGEAQQVTLDRDLVLEWNDPRTAPGTARFSAAEHAGARYLMVRYRPELPTRPERHRRDWVILFESSGDRNPLLARTQIEVVRTLLAHAEHDDTFVLLTAGTRVRAFAAEPKPVTPATVQAAVEFLERAHLIGALDLGQAFAAAEPFLRAGRNPWLVHIGSGLPSLGERRADVLAGRLPAGVPYVGIGVGRHWGRDFMKTAAERSGGYFTQINPDEPVAWRAFDLLATLNTPRLLNVEVVDDDCHAVFLPCATTLAHGEELCAVARIEPDAHGQLLLPTSLTVVGKLDGRPFQQTLRVTAVAEPAGYLPRTWAKLEIDRLLAQDAEAHKDAVIALSQAMYVMTPFTSLLVLENDAMYEEFRVDRGRQDHWAEYNCPKKIVVISEPLDDPPATQTESASRADERLPANAVLNTILVRVPPRALTWGNRDDPFLGHQKLTAAELYQFAFAVPYLADHPVLSAGGPVVGQDGRVRYHERFSTLERYHSALAAQLGRANDPNAFPFGWNTFPTASSQLRVPVHPAWGWFGGASFGGLPYAGWQFGGFHFGGVQFGGMPAGNFGLPMNNELLAFPQVGNHFNVMSPNAFFTQNGVLNNDLNNWQVRPGGFFAGGFQFGGFQFGGFQFGGFQFGGLQFGGQFGGFQFGNTVNLSGQFGIMGGPSNTTSFHANDTRLGSIRPEGYRPLLRVRSEWDVAMDLVNDRGRDRANRYGILDNRAATADEIALRLLNDSGPRSLLYASPQVQQLKEGDTWRVFGDLVSYAPGMNTSAADIQAVLDAEARPDPRHAPGRIDREALLLIARARAGTGWQAVTLPGVGRNPEYTVVFDGRGRYAYERRVSEGLREQVVCDGETLWHLYPELGLGARRTVSRFHRAEFLELVPWVLPPAEDLARGADLRRVGERTVAIVPHGSESARTADGRPAAYEVVHLLFAEEGRLQECRLVEMPSKKTLRRETYDTDGTIRQWDHNGRLVALLTRNVRPAPAPDLAPATDELVVLPLPYRTSKWFDRAIRQRTMAQHAPDAPEPSKAEQEQRAEARRLELLATGFAEGADVEELWQNLQSNRRHGDNEPLGCFTLLAASGVPVSPVPREDMHWVDVLQAHPHAPLARYLSQWSRQHYQQSPDEIGAVGGPPDGFLQRMATFHDIVTRWQVGNLPARAKERNEAEYRRILRFVRDCKDANVAMTLLEMVVADPSWPDPLCQEIADAYRLFQDDPVWGYAARTERIRYLARLTDRRGAAREFVELHAEMLQRDGVLPPLTEVFVTTMTERTQDGGADPRRFHEWARKTAARLIAEERRVPVIGLAWQCTQLHLPRMLADELLAMALKDVPAADRQLVTLAAVEYLWRTGDLDRADELLQKLLADPGFAKRPVLWRLRSALAAQRGKAAVFVRCMETVVELEYGPTATVLVLPSMRSDFMLLLGSYAELAAAAHAIDVQPPADLLPRIVRAAERWRQLDGNVALPCWAAAQALLALGERELAWEYITTVWTISPDKLLAWIANVEFLYDPELSIRAYAAAVEADPTNAELLWAYAEYLQRIGRIEQARQLLRRLAEGSWPKQYERRQQEARKLLLQGL